MFYVNGMVSTKVERVADIRFLIEGMCYLLLFQFFFVSIKISYDRLFLSVVAFGRP